MLKLWIAERDAGTAELCAEVRVGDFCGRGAAWINLSDVETAAAAFSRFPLSKEAGSNLRGGYWETGEEKLLQEHLYVSAYQSSPVGTISVPVRLASPQHDPNRPELVFSISVELVTNYQAFGRFSRDLLALAREECEEAVLEEDA